ncbi:MAG: ABC transporter substrate-binding protein [Desulfobulbaceae bacterium]|nr:ABC transporter substrate-binding protein [Desulfobulbaceae bacterium]
MVLQRMVGAKVVLVLLSFYLLTAALPVFAATTTEPMEQVKASVDAILLIVRENKQNLHGELAGTLRKQIVDIVYDRFDFRAMSQLALAKNWKTINAKEQDHFVFLFAKLLENTYYDRINSYSNEEVVFKEQQKKEDKAVVSSVVIRNNVETPVVYKLRSKNDKWLVYDVIIEGVSLVRNYRTQFDSIIEKEKYPGLVKRLEEKIEKKDTGQKPL